MEHNYCSHTHTITTDTFGVYTAYRQRRIKTRAHVAVGRKSQSGLATGWRRLFFFFIYILFFIFVHGDFRKSSTLHTPRVIKIYACFNTPPHPPLRESLIILLRTPEIREDCATNNKTLLILYYYTGGECIFFLFIIPEELIVIVGGFCFEISKLYSEQFIYIKKNDKLL